MRNNHYQLDKVVILSRHGIRTPLQNTLEFLDQATSFTWPKWDHPYGYLTTRGGALETYFGHYLSQWLEQQNISFSPENPQLFVYANSLQRTVATAQFLIMGAYAGHDITINHKYPIEKMDPIFDPALEDNSPEFKQAVLNDIELEDKTHDIFKNLAPAYQILSDILDYKNSQLYATHQCALADIPQSLYFEKHQEPALLGALAVGICAVDSFLLQYYSAFPKDQIAWGRIDSLEQWQQITQIRNQYINLICHTKTIADRAANKLIKMINSLVANDQYQVSLLVGHDSTIASLLGALDFESYSLPNQFETTPIGGKVIFQRFCHRQTGQYYFKAEYVYQTFEQLHTGQALDINNPPAHFELKLKNANLNADGYYPWAEFEKRINITNNQ